MKGGIWLGPFSRARTAKRITLISENVVRRPVEWGTDYERRAWCAAVNEDTGAALLLLSPARDAAIEDAGHMGRVLVAADDEVRLPANETVERVHYLVSADRLDDALAFRALVGPTARLTRRCRAPLDSQPGREISGR